MPPLLPLPPFNAPPTPKSHSLSFSLAPPPSPLHTHLSTTMEAGEAPCSHPTFILPPPPPTLSLLPPPPLPSLLEHTIPLEQLPVSSSRLQTFLQYLPTASSPSASSDDRPRWWGVGEEEGRAAEAETVEALNTRPWSLLSQDFQGSSSSSGPPPFCHRDERGKSICCEESLWGGKAPLSFA